MRIYSGREPLDASAMHPESYDATRQLQKVGDGQLDSMESLASKLKIGTETLHDIQEKLEGHSLDPRAPQQSSRARNASAKASRARVVDAMAAGRTIKT